MDRGIYLIILEPSKLGFNGEIASGFELQKYIVGPSRRRVQNGAGLPSKTKTLPKDYLTPAV